MRTCPPSLASQTGWGQHIPISYLFPVCGSAVIGLKACDLSTTGWSSRTMSHNKTLFPISWASLLFCHSNTGRVHYHSEEGSSSFYSMLQLSDAYLKCCCYWHRNCMAILSDRAWSMFNTICKARFWNSILFCFNIFCNLCLTYAFIALSCKLEADFWKLPNVTFSETKQPLEAP